MPYLVDIFVQADRRNTVLGAELPGLLRGGARISEVRGSAKRIYDAIETQG